MSRPTRELLVLIVLATACSVVVISVTGLLAIELLHPEVDTTKGLSAAWDVTALLFGLVGGWLLAHLRNGNGH